jgi:hypothetical protein
MRTRTLLLLASLFAFFGLQAQDQGYLDGKVFLTSEDEVAVSATVRIFQGENLINGTTTDYNGLFRIKPLNPGKYSVVISYVGYHNDTIINIPITSNEGTDLGSVVMVKNSILKDVTITGYKEPLINIDGGMTHAMTPKQVEALPNPTDIVSNLQYISSEFQVEPGTREIHFRGSRDGETAFYVDGVRVENTDGIPKFAIAGMKVYAGGVPARYGDFTGGVVVVETKSYFDWEQEQRALIRTINDSRAPKTEKKDVEEDEDAVEEEAAEELSKRELRKKKRAERKAARKAKRNS